jgi:Pregnancy-associated plasma protein-A
MKNIVILILGLFLLNSCKTHKKTHEGFPCTAGCDVTHQEKTNVQKVLDEIEKTKAALPYKGYIIFPLRLIWVTNPNDTNESYKQKLTKTVEILNEGFDGAKIKFEIFSIDTIHSELSIENLISDEYRPYDDFSKKHDLENIITVYYFAHGEPFCETNSNSISCAKKGGFSYILSDLSSNVVISHFDVEERKVLVHELGHFFGLFHTFEEHPYGKDYPGYIGSTLAGDNIDDTPPDPTNAYEAYVNYSTCEMQDFKDSKTGQAWKPQINNYMSYYKPCYLKPYTFSAGQLKFLAHSARNEMRSFYAKK